METSNSAMLKTHAELEIWKSREETKKKKKKKEEEEEEEERNGLYPENGGKFDIKVRKI